LNGIQHRRQGISTIPFGLKKVKKGTWGWVNRCCEKAVHREI